MNAEPRHLLEEEIERLRKLNAQLNENLSSVQARCTELLEENRDLRAGTIDEQVREFHDVMGIENRTTLGVPSDDVIRLRMRLVIEEAFEFVEACVSSSPSRYAGVLDDKRAVREVLEMLLDAISNSVELDPDIVEIADALADLDYVVAGTRLAYGIPRKPVADEVHRSNMAKAPNGIVLRDEHDKVKKPPGWTPPNIRKALGLDEEEGES